MKYLNQKCTHCDKLFEKDDDVVVCPVCGTPQHRACYEENNQCINFNKHAEGFVWSADDTTTDSSQADNDFTICSNCGTKNSGDSFFCKHCSNPLTDAVPNSQNVFYGNTTNSNENIQGMPFVISQLALDPNKEIADDVKLSEAQKYVKNNTLLYSLVFKRLKDHNKGRFNFAAFIFTGGWFLYRKQYLLGTILTVLFALCTITSNLLYNPVLAMLETYNLIIDGTILYDQIYILSQNQQLLFLAFLAASLFEWVLMIVSGLIANRCYYKHVVKKVRQTKNKFSTEDEVNKHLEKTGGVNTPLAYILFFAYVVVNCIPLFF